MTILKTFNTLHERLIKLTIRSKFEFQKLVAKFSFMTNVVAKIEFRHVEKKRVGEPRVFAFSGYRQTGLQASRSLRKFTHLKVENFLFCYMRSEGKKLWYHIAPLPLLKREKKPKTHCNVAQHRKCIYKTHNIKSTMSSIGREYS